MDFRITLAIWIWGIHPSFNQVFIRENNVQRKWDVRKTDISHKRGCMRSLKMLKFSYFQEVAKDLIAHELISGKNHCWVYKFYDVSWFFENDSRFLYNGEFKSHDLRVHLGVPQEIISFDI